MAKVIGSRVQNFFEAGTNEQSIAAVTIAPFATRAALTTFLAGRPQQAWRLNPAADRSPLCYRRSGA